MSKSPLKNAFKQFSWRQIIKWVMVGIVLAILALTITIIRNELGYKKGNNTYADIVRQVVTTPETKHEVSTSMANPTPLLEGKTQTPGVPLPTATTLISPTQDSTLSNAMDLARIRSLINVDFAALKAINPEVEGWIFSEDSPISYPIVRGENNERYLKQLIDGSENQLGTLFVDYRNQAGFNDENTLVYGHNMEDDSMLATLPEYKHEDYYTKHPNLYLFLPDQTYRLELIGGFDVDPEDLGLLQMNFASPLDHDNFVFQVRTRSWFRSQMEAKSTDQFVSLITCNYDTEEGRFVLVGRLVPLN